MPREPRFNLRLTQNIAGSRSFMDNVNRIVGSGKVFSFISIAVLVLFVVAGRCSRVRVCLRDLRDRVMYRWSLTQYTILYKGILLTKS